jgi:RNA polymerase sigma-70 factor (ECF subfamily)
MEPMPPNGPTAGPANAADDYELFISLFSRNQGRILAFVRALVPNPTQADDVFQTTSLVLWRSFGTFRRDAEFLPWAIGVARHQVLVHWRSRRRDRHVFSEALLVDLAAAAESELGEAELRQQALDACVSSLPERQRDLIRLFYGENQSAGDIAVSWNRTVHAVYKALTTLRRALLECVTQRLARMARDDGGDAAPSPTAR